LVLTAFIVAAERYGLCAPGRGDVFFLGRAPWVPASSVSITRMNAPLLGVKRVARRPAAFK
jgi:hypothetical protein